MSELHREGSNISDIFRKPALDIQMRKVKKSCKTCGAEFETVARNRKRCDSCNRKKR